MNDDDNHHTAPLQDLKYVEYTVRRTTATLFTHGVLLASFPLYNAIQNPPLLTTPAHVLDGDKVDIRLILFALLCDAMLIAGLCMVSLHVILQHTVKMMQSRLAWRCTGRAMGGVITLWHESWQATMSSDGCV